MFRTGKVNVGNSNHTQHILPGREVHRLTYWRNVYDQNVHFILSIILIKVGSSPRKL